MTKEKKQYLIGILTGVAIAVSIFSWGQSFGLW